MLNRHLHGFLFHFVLFYIQNMLVSEFGIYINSEFLFVLLCPLVFACLLPLLHVHMRMSKKVVAIERYDLGEHSHSVFTMRMRKKFAATFQDKTICEFLAHVHYTKNVSKFAEIEHFNRYEFPGQS